MEKELEIEAEKDFREVIVERISLNKKAIAFYENKISLKEVEIKRLESMLHLYDSTDRKNGIKPFTKQPAKQKNERIQWSKIVIPLLEKENRLLKTNEIIDITFPGLNQSLISEYRSALSGSLGGLSERHRVKQYKIKGQQGNLWGLPSMLDGDRPKAKYDPDL